MEIRSSVKTLNYTRKLLMQETSNILPFEVCVQKPEASGKLPMPLPRTSPEKEQVSYDALNTLLQELSATKTGWAHTCMIIRNGNVICEESWKPYSTKYWHVSHSLCKSFTGTAIGMLVDEQKLRLDEKICDIFPERCNLLTNRRIRLITIEHLLQMSSGVTFKESGSVIEKDWLKGFFEADVVFDPGTQFDYNSMNSYVLSCIVKQKTGIGLKEYLTSRLFEPLGFGDVAWETCPSGIEKGGWGMYLYLEDAIKLGLLYLNKGVYQTQAGKTKRLLSEEWIAKATTPYMKRESGEEYGYHLWVHSEDHTFLFNGMFGQYILVAPELNLIIGLNAGAGHTFTQSESYTAVRKFLKTLQTDIPPTQAQQSALSYTQKQLQYDTPTYAFVEPVKQTLLQRLASFLQDSPQDDFLEKQQAQINALNGKRYTIEKNKSGLLPTILSCMNDWYTSGITELCFSKRNEVLYLDWYESDCIWQIPIGFGDFYNSTLDANGNQFLIASQASWAKDEDDFTVLKLKINFLETSSTRLLKIIFQPNSMIFLKFDETPGLSFAMKMLNNSSYAKTSFIDVFRDMDYFWYRVDKLCRPVLKGAPPDRAQELLSTIL